MLTPASMSHLRHFSADRFFISSTANADPSACSLSPEPCAVTSPAASVAGDFSSPSSHDASLVTPASRTGTGEPSCERPHRYEKYGSFGATCADCHIGTVWDSAERREPGPCSGSPKSNPKDLT